MPSEIVPVEIPADFEYQKGGKKFFLRNYDMVFVRTNPDWHIQKNATILGEVQFPGTYSLERTDEKVSDLVKRAGGIKKGTAYLEEENNETKYPIMTEDNKIDNMEKTTVPHGHCFVLGDNRANSRDSRHFGPVPLADVKGRVDYIYWPALNWSRFGKYGDGVASEK